jgi:Protein of unknown function (DUF2752)
VLVTTRTLPAAGTGGASALRAPLATAGAALAATTYVGLVDPNQSGHYPTCPFLFITGYYCPGCGSLRAVHALAHGDVGAAVGFNVLTVVSLVVLTGFWGLWVVRSWQGQPRTRVAPAWTLYLVTGAVVVFWIVRNLTLGEALAP